MGVAGDIKPPRDFILVSSAWCNGDSPQNPPRSAALVDRSTWRQNELDQAYCRAPQSLVRQCLGGHARLHILLRRWRPRRGIQPVCPSLVTKINGSDTTRNITGLPRFPGGD
jgi:hypothetical protein